MTLNPNAITPELFLKEYWQKKPVVIRQALIDFKDLLSPEELAGLACEPEVESRRIYKAQGQWQAEFGPFDCYQALGEEDWTLIVQAVNHWLPSAEQLIQCFDFIPRWRFDDLMVSYGRPGGGVGPHIDLYDVFICQGSGSRRWRVGDKGPYKQFAAHPALLHTEAFEPIIDTELTTGDILYIPPGFPHDGISLEPSMSFSVGYRTDSAQAMQSALADFMIDQDINQQLITDPERSLSTKNGLISDADKLKIKQHLINAISDDVIEQFAGEYLTRSKCALDLEENVIEAECLYQIDEVLDTLATAPLTKLGGLRCFYYENYQETRSLYIYGERYQLPESIVSIIPILCNQSQLSIQDLKAALENTTFSSQFIQWVNKGFWYFEMN